MGTEKILISTTKNIQRAAVSASTEGDNVLVAASTIGHKTKVLGMILVVSADLDIRIEDGAGGDALTGVISLAADGNGFVLPMATPGLHWLETSDDTALSLELAGTGTVSGIIVYYQET